MNATSQCLNTPPLSLAERRLKLRGERIMLLLAQLEAETAGEDDVAADCLRRIADVEGKLRAIDGAMNGG